jgi:hypothetical protein
MALPRRLRQEHRPTQEWCGKVDCVCEKPHYERADDLATIGHRPKPADCYALEPARNLISGESRRDRRHESGGCADREAQDTEEGGIRQERHAAEERRIDEQAGG